ncbi:MAG: hypothetical protein M3P23_14335 [Actinomycetota bacterium]|nr:hypothetical protein [Actinomycetota bacterium]
MTALRTPPDAPRAALTHQGITDDYLAGFAQSGQCASDILDGVRPSTVDTCFGGRSLSRPVFLGRDDISRLTRDLELLHALITGLPDRVFGGDLSAFARAVGATDAQATASVRGHGDAAPRMSRADLFLDHTGFRLMEINWGSALGGLDSACLNRAMLGQPFVAEFVQRHGLTYVDPMVELVDTLFTECKVALGRRPTVALADWPESFPTLEPQLRASAQRLAAFGMDAYPCHVGQLSYADGRVWLGDLPIDIVYRLFLMEDLLDESGPGLIEPILRAAERREVGLFVGMDAELYGSKGALALLSDEGMRHLYRSDELAALDRVLPWTKAVRPGRVTVDGGHADLLDYALAQQQELILKPTLMHGGLGIVPGWVTTADLWREQVEAAMDQPYVLQRRIHALPEAVPTDTGLESWTLTWGAFMAARGYGGMFLRGSTDPAMPHNISNGATGTCCFHQQEAS